MDAEMRKWLLTLTIVVAILAVLGVGVVGYCGYRALKKEERYASIRKVMDCCIEYVELTSGDWPRSWSDLERTDAEIDWQFAKEICTVDFSTDATKISHMTEQNFDAVFPRKPTFKPTSLIAKIIETCKKFAKQNQIPTTHPRGEAVRAE